MSAHEEAMQSDEPVPLLDMLDLDSVADEIEPDVRVEKNGILIIGIDVQEVEVDLKSMCGLAADVLLEEGIDRGRVDLHLVEPSVIAELNAEHLDGTGPTDVLSFPLDPDAFEPPADASADGSPMLGDVVLCPAVAAAQADDHAGSIDAEFALLVIHGVLHLLGHDHVEPSDTVAMQARERIHLARLGHEHPGSQHG